MHNLEIFKSEEFGEIRTVSVDNEICFVAKDMATALGYQDTTNAIKQHCRGVAKHHPIIDSLGRTQEVRVIKEGDVYRLIAHSKLPKAVRFESWVFEEVLPTIRKNGIYMTDEKALQIVNNPNSLLDLLKLATKQIEEQQLEIQIMKPKALFADAITASKTSILIGDLAKILRQNGIETGQKRLFETLREQGYLIKRGTSKNLPTQMAMEQGLFEIKESSYIDGNGVNKITRTTKVTPKGQKHFINKFLTTK